MSIDRVDVHEHRRPDHDIEPIFVERWSPRAMTGEPIAPAELARLFEAARWAPSSRNAQPWRFLYARRGTAHFDRFLALLVEGNRPWAASAGVLVVVVSRSVSEHDGEAARTHSFDAGAAWMSLALQGARMRLVVHGMQGFDYDAARAVLAVPPEFTVDAMIALGRPGRVEDLPERYRERERPSPRRPIAEIAFEGGF